MVQEVNQSHIVGSHTTFGIDNAAVEICIYVTYTVLCQTINILGIVTNIINIVCFVKQGFKDSINVSLLGLSVSDLVSLLTMACSCIFCTPAFMTADLPFDSMDIAYLVFAMPHFAFTRVSSCITAMITMERCLSIVAPLKVRHIITPKRAAVIVVCIFIIFTFSVTPIYTVNRLAIRFSVLKNKSIVLRISANNRQQVERITVTINNFFIPFCAFTIVAICTVILSTQLRTTAKWRKTTISDDQSDRISSRNQKVASMVVTISTLFIACFVPICVVMLVMAFVPDLWMDGKYLNVSMVMGGCSYIFESINSSVNIFIYHHMSTRYRDTFRSLFICGKKYNS